MEPRPWCLGTSSLPGQGLLPSPQTHSVFIFYSKSGIAPKRTPLFTFNSQGYWLTTSHGGGRNTLEIRGKHAGIIRLQYKVTDKSSSKRKPLTCTRIHEAWDWVSTWQPRLDGKEINIESCSTWCQACEWNPLEASLNLVPGPLFPGGRSVNLFHEGSISTTAFSRDHRTLAPFWTRGDRKVTIHSWHHHPHPPVLQWTRSLVSLSLHPTARQMNNKTSPIFP